ncbi:MAG: hypothetical protein QS721_13325 [Candidatus Endonucleobacter sp. (ex Gigantidas childressi)]|nr:hypothetical protein [Candidatus Endonucleobacter sp. (ex Gigantidas childressi)]
MSKSKSKGYQKVTKHDVKKEKATKNLPKKEIIGNNILKKEEVETEKLNKFKDCKEKEKFKKVYNGEEKAKLDEKNAKKDKVKLEKINAEKEKVKLEKINAEKEKVKFEKINAEKEKANLDKANLDKANAEKEKVKLEKINAEKEKAKLDKANAEKEKAKLDKANAEKEKAKLDKANAEKEKAKLDKANAEKEKAKLDKANAEKEKAKLDKANAEKEKAKLDKANAEKEKAKLDEVNAAKTQAKLDEVNAAKTKAKLDEVNAAKTKAKLDEVNAAKTKAKLDEVNAAKTQAKLDEVNAAKTKAKLDEVNAAKTKVDNEKKVIESKKADKVTYDNTETEKKNFDNIETQPAKETKKKNKEEEIVYGVATKEYLNEENLLPWDESDKEAQINNLIKAEEKKQLDIKNSRLKKTNITTEMLNGERCYIISDTKYILASADNICIGQKNGPVAAVTFPDDKNEMLILLKNETESIPVIANRNGDYIQIFKGEAIRGFSSLYYSYSGSGNYSTSDKRTIPVFIDGKHFSIDKTRGEQYIEIGNKKFIACIDGRVREIIIGEVTSGFFDHAYYIKNNNTHRMPIEQHEALERSIDRIRRVATPAEARDVLTKFFNSVSGKTLTQNNHYAIDKKKTLDFIVCYKKAIELEIKEEKEDKEIKAEQDKKKNERLKAISEIKDFIENINNNDPKLNEKCRCAIQLSGRVRERSLVTQKAIPYCGGFAMLQEAWGINPCKMVHIALDLLEKGETTTDTMVVGCVKKLSTPDYFKWRDYDEAYADSLLISIHYNLKKASSLAQEDAMNATYLGVPVKKCNYPDSKSDSFKKQDMQTRFLQELTLVSRGKGSICATAHGAINIFFLHELQKGFNRKNVSGPVNIEAAFKEFKSEEQINHAVVIEKFHVTGVGDNKFIECKLHTWGVMHHLKMRVSTFFDNFDPSSFFIANMDASQKFEFFSDIDKVVMRKNDNTATIGVLKLLDGTEHHLKKGDQISIENIVYKFNGGADWDTYPLS